MDHYRHCRFSWGLDYCANYKSNTRFSRCFELWFLLISVCLIHTEDLPGSSVRYSTCLMSSYRCSVLQRSYSLCTGCSSMLLMPAKRTGLLYSGASLPFLSCFLFGGYCGCLKIRFYKALKAIHTRRLGAGVPCYNWGITKYL